jgi:hypothetical protein
MNRALRLAADEVQKEHPDVHSKALAGRLEHLVAEALAEWPRTATDPAGRDRIKARLAAGIRGMDEVFLNLDKVSVELDTSFGRYPADTRFKITELLLDVLTEQPTLRTLDVAAPEGGLMNRMTRLLDTRPELLRSLDLTTSCDYRSRLAEATRGTQHELSKKLPKQKNLTVLKLRDPNPGLSGYRPSGLQITGMGVAIASLPSLQSLTLCGYGYGEKEASELTDILRKLPALQDLDLSRSRLQGAAFAQVASSLPDIPRLRHLNLSRTKFDPGWAGQLAQVLPRLAELRTLKLDVDDLNATDMEDLAGGLVSLKQLETLRVSYSSWDQDAGLRCVSTALAGMPALRHLHLDGLGESRPQKADKLADALRPLEGHQKLQVHLGLPGSYQAELQAMQTALPGMRFST